MEESVSWFTTAEAQDGAGSAARRGVGAALRRAKEVIWWKASWPGWKKRVQRGTDQCSGAGAERIRMDRKSENGLDEVDLWKAGLEDAGTGPGELLADDQWTGRIFLS